MGGKELKGATLIFEQVMLFAISVAIFLILISVFNVYQNFFVSVSGDNQLDETKEWISSNILKAAEKEDATSFHIIPIPRYISDAVYEVRLSHEGLHVRELATNSEKFSTLYSLNESFVLVPGNVTSIKGKITIKKENNQIIIV